MISNLLIQISAQNIVIKENDHDDGSHLSDLPNIYNYKLNNAALEILSTAAPSEMAIKDDENDKDNIIQYAHPYKTNKLMNKDKLMLVSYTANNLHNLRNNYKKNVVNIFNKKLYKSKDDTRDNLDKINDYNVSTDEMRYERSRMKTPYSTPSSYHRVLVKKLQIDENGQSVNSTDRNELAYPAKDEDRVAAKHVAWNNENYVEESVLKIQKRELSALERVDQVEFITDDNAPLALPLRPIIRGPYEEDLKEEMAIVFAEQHSPVKINCEVDLDITSSVWLKDGQVNN